MRLTEPFNIVGLDPGGTTGIAHSYWDGMSEPSIESFNYVPHEMGPHIKHHRTLWDYLHHMSMLDIPLTIVCEAFEFRQNYSRDKVELISREYIGIANLVAQQTGAKLIMQSASQAKNFVPDDKLERMGILVKPPHPNRHKNDALRHVVRYQVARLGIRSPITDSWRNDGSSS